MSLKAIDTRYGGYLFRSRLEARWAVFFDRMGMKWTYEPEGFELPSGRYLPDFLMTDYDVWLEIKPVFSQTSGTLPSQIHQNRTDEIAVGFDEKQKCQDLAWATRKSCVIFCGDPLFVLQNLRHNILQVFWDVCHAFDEEGCYQLGGATIPMMQHICRHKQGFAHAQYAREARFEFGAKP